MLAAIEMPFAVIANSRNRTANDYSGVRFNWISSKLTQSRGRRGSSQKLGDSVGVEQQSDEFQRQHDQFHVNLQFDLTEERGQKEQKGNDHQGHGHLDSDCRRGPLQIQAETEL